MTETLEDLQNVARKANAAIARIQAQERRERNERLVGKLFRYRNSYSCPEKPSDYWWLYARVENMDKDGYLRVFKFQTDTHGNVRVDFDDFVLRMDEYEPCSPVSFKKAWAKLMAKLHAVV